MIVSFVYQFYSGLPSPDFNITTTTITAQITGLSGFLWEYQLSIILLQANGEKTYVSDRLDGGQPTETTVIRNLYPFTMYNIELQVRRSTTDPWSYPASREVKTLEEGIQLLKLDTLNV